MDLKDALRYQLESSAHQIDKVLEGLPEDKWEAKMRGDCMSPSEAVAHLTECYIAAQKDLAGVQHEWGSYLPSGDTPEALVAEMREERKKAWDAMVSRGDEESVKAATQYVILHDAYHVGQLAMLRLGLDRDWDPYSIY